MDKFKIDSHKLIYHIDRVHDWLSGKRVYPLYIEIATSGGCNHRCTYCALDFMEYAPRLLNTTVLKDRLTEMGSFGVKSIMYAGEGEPLLHRGMKDIINHTKKSGIDVAITTNGVFLDKGLVDFSLADISWIKVSINGATDKTYSKIHRANPEDFYRVIRNLSYAVKVKKVRGYKCVLGAQLLLLPENAKEVVSLAKMAKDIGLDYLVIKPYSQHPFSKTTRYRDIRYSKYLSLSDKLDKFNSAGFNVIFRINTMKKWDKGIRNYKHCYAFPFWAYIDAAGDVWGCSAYLGDKRFLCGNIYKSSFRKIFAGGKRDNMIRFSRDRLDTNHCRVNCRMDEINRYLWDLKHLPEHVNFI